MGRCDRYATLQMQRVHPHVQRAHRHTAGASAEARKWLDYARAIGDGLTLRKAAARVGVHLETSVPLAASVPGNVEKGEAQTPLGHCRSRRAFILKSAKGSRGLVGRAPRKRGGKPKKTGTSPDDYDIVLIARDRSGATSDQVLYDLTAPTTPKS